MIDLTIFIEFYFTRYLFVAGAICGLVNCIKMLAIGWRK